MTFIIVVKSLSLTALTTQRLNHGHKKKVVALSYCCQSLTIKKVTRSITFIVDHERAIERDD